MFKRLLRSNSGCYTCRLRRKKCSEDRPVCQECKSLEITCHFGEDKPDWMDGGPRQKEMADKIKAQVKKQASQRRDRKYLEMLESGSKMNLNDDESSYENRTGRPEAFVMPTNGMDVHTSPESFNTNYSGHNGHHQPNSNGSATSGATPPSVPWQTQLLARKEDPAGAPDLHLQLVYLDFIFPFLYPYYKPPILHGGRGWVMDALQSNSSIYFSSISLASYYFGICLANGEVIHQECTDQLSNQLDSQLERALQELQREVRGLDNCGGGFDQRSGLVVMQSILQLLVMEIATSNKDNWRLHLNAAVALFHQILPDPETWTETLHNLYSPRWPPPSMGIRRPWSTNQASLRFFTAQLFYMDIVSSITLGSSPRLYSYHANVIPSCGTLENYESPRSAGPLFMEEFTGLQNWMIQMIGDVASLDAWKKAQKKAGSLSIAQLISKGQVLSEIIKKNLAAWESQQQSQVSTPQSDLYKSVSTLPGPDAEERHILQGIWLLATLSYLNVVLSGWQPLNPEIRWSVAKATELLMSLPSTASIQAMAWPMCVSGCLSPKEDESRYRALVQRLGPLQVFGTAKQAMEVMERVWATRGIIDETWDVSKCMNVLGYGVLLI